MGKNKIKYWAIGAIASLGLFAFYFALLSLANSFQHALDQFALDWPWIVLLAIGFGLQIGLYFFARDAFKASNAATAEVAASGTVSGASMVACCAHHLTDVLPLIGISALASVLDSYKMVFILTGIFSSLAGALMMLGMLKKNSALFPENSFVQKLSPFNFDFLFRSTVASAIVAISFLVALNLRGF
ncbi:MAG: hypothetical protein V1494_04385 [Candidatus Diapherotrites archaeon]